MSQQTRYPPLPTSRRQMASYACAWIPMTLMRPPAKIITRCPWWRKSLMSLCTLTSSPSWMPPWILVNHPWPGVQLLMTFNSPFRDTISCNFPLAWSVSQDIFQKKMDQILRVQKNALESQNDITVHGRTEVEHDACLWNLMWITHKYDWCSIHRKHTWRLKLSISLAASTMPMVSTQTRERLMLYTPYQYPQMSQNSKEFLGLVMYLSPFIPGLSTLTALCMSCSRRTQTSAGTTHTMSLFSRSRKLLSVTPPQVFWPLTTGDNTGQCLPGRPCAALLQNGKPIAFVSKALTKLNADMWT